MLVEGQVHGGVAQGIGQALMEDIRYDEDGQLISGSFMDYAMPRADDMPDFAFSSVPATTNPLGAKGCGEAGCSGSLPSIINAIVDVLARRPAPPISICRQHRNAFECPSKDGQMTEHQESVRAEVRAWLDSNGDPDLTLLEWRNRLVDPGWGMPQWPKEWFGRELSVGLVTLSTRNLNALMPLPSPERERRLWPVR